MNMSIEHYCFDYLNEVNENELYDMYRLLTQQISDLNSNNHKINSKDLLKNIQINLCYVEREIQIRNIRKSIHATLINQQ